MQKITAGDIDISDIIQEATEKAETADSQLIGAAISRELTLRLLMYDATDEQKAAVKAGKFEYNGNTYNVYSHPKHYSEKTSITAYDLMGEASAKYRDAGVSGDYTAGEIWYDIANKIGVDCDTSELGDAADIICKGKAKLSTHTMRDWLAWIAEAAGGNAIIQGDKLTVKTLSKTVDLTVEDASEVTDTDDFTVGKVKKYYKDEAVTYGDGDGVLYLTTGNPLIEESQTEAIYNEYSGLHVYECSSLKTWISQTANIDIGDALQYNGKAYIITGYTRTHHGNSAEDTLDLRGSTETNAARGEKSTKTKDTREAGLDGSEYTPDSVDTSGSSGGGGTTGDVIANELLTDGDPHWHIKTTAMTYTDDSTDRLTVGEDVRSTEDGERLVNNATYTGISYSTPIRLAAADDTDKTIARLDTDGTLQYNCDIDFVNNNGNGSYKTTITADNIICRTLTIEPLILGEDESAGLRVRKLGGELEGQGMTGSLVTPFGTMYFTHGLLTGFSADDRAAKASFTWADGFGADSSDDDSDDEWL